MKVKDLIIELQKMPQEAEVLHLWDGEPRTRINFVWESRNGDVITADYFQDCYTAENRPKDTTCGNDDRWATPDDPDYCSAWLNDIYEEN